jgi:hypothetical protein
MQASDMEHLGVSPDCDPVNITGKPVLFLGNQSLPPMNYLKDGKPVGIVIDLVEALAQRMHYPVEIRLMDGVMPRNSLEVGRLTRCCRSMPTLDRLKIF